jgi:hypothetical protein
MGKYLRISSYIRKPFLLYNICNCSTLNFHIYEENLIFFFYQCITTALKLLQVGTIIAPRIYSMCIVHQYAQISL